MEKNAIQFTLQSYPDNPKVKTKGICKTLETLENDRSLLVGGKILPRVEKLPMDELAIQIALVTEGPIAIS